MKHILITTIAAVVLVATTAFADPIHDAVWGADLAGVQAELDKGADVNAKGDGGWTPLHDATYFGHKEIVKLLIENGADVNAKTDAGGTPLDWATEKNRTEVADLLRKHGGKHGTIHSAAGGGDIEAVKEFLAAGADVNAKDDDGATPLDWAISRDHRVTADLLRKHGGKHGTIHSAVGGGDIEAVKEFLAAGADVNAKVNDGRTPLDMAIQQKNAEIADLLRKHGGKTFADFVVDEDLLLAAYEGNIEAAKEAIATGADVNAKDWMTGGTPLDTAAWEGHKEIVELLIDNGADVNAKSDFGYTPLRHAAARGHKEIVELLIANGADVNAKTGSGLTPLDTAAMQGHKEIVELLIAKGADVNAKTVENWTPLHYAAGRGQKEIVERLIANGADVNANSVMIVFFDTPISGTPLDWAIRNDHTETADLLRKHGGKTGEELALMPPRLVQHGRFAFSFDAKEGKVYEVQDSFDLLNWEVIKAYTGTGDSVRFDEERDHDPPKIFYRVKVVE